MVFWGVFWCGFFLGGYFIANLAWRRRRRPPTRPSSRRWATRPSGCGDRRTAPSRRSASRSSPRARFSSSDGLREDFLFFTQLSPDYCSYYFLAKNTCNMCYVEDNPKNYPCVLKVYLWRIACEYVLVWQYDPNTSVPGTPRLLTSGGMVRGATRVADRDPHGSGLFLEAGSGSSFKILKL